MATSSTSCWYRRWTTRAIEWLGRVTIVGALAVAAAPSARAQTSDEHSASHSDGGWVREFDSVTVKRIHPTDLPANVKPGEKIAIRTKSDQLPHPPTHKLLRKVAKFVDARVVRVVSVKTPPKPYRQVPMIYHGHALWISPDGGQSPVLVSPLNWLSNADRVFVAPRRTADRLDETAPRKSRRRTLATVTAGNKGQRWLDDHRDELIAVEPRHPDRRRNLVTLVGADKSLAAPSVGLHLFEVSDKALFGLYGYTPYLGTSLTAADMLPTRPDNPALAFYWQSTYPAILGAPLVSQEGHLVAINSHRHPKNDDAFLAIPTAAISSYLDAGSEEADTDGAESNHQ